MVFLEFEKPLESLYQQLDKIKQVGEAGDIRSPNWKIKLKVSVKPFTIT